MKNLLKNNVRSWKSNKVSIIGLSFLTFFGLGSYCVLSNTIANIGDQYSAISQKGALHDITVSELYNVGNSHYQTNTGGVQVDHDSATTTFKGVDSFWEGETKIETTQLCSATLDEIKQTKEGKYFIPIPDQKVIGDEKKGKSFVRKYHVTLDEGLSTSLFAEFAHRGAEVDPTTKEYKDPQAHALCSFDVVITEAYVESSAAYNLQQIIEKNKTKKISEWASEDLEVVAQNNILKQDFKDFTSSINDQSKRISQEMTTNNTPMSNEIKNNYSNVLEYRTEKSVNITVASQFYKVVESNPSDKVNKMVLFNDINGRTGGNLPGINDFAPYGGKIEFVNEGGKIIEPGTPIKQGDQTLFYIPKNLNELMDSKIYDMATIKSWNNEAQFAYSQMMQIRFKSMKSGKMAEAIVESFGTICDTLAAVNITKKLDYNTKFTDLNDDICKAYMDYYENWFIGNAEMITIAQDGSTAITWTVGPTPQTLKITNWTTKFSVVNPQYLKANNKSTLDPELINKFKPYSEWYKVVYGKEVKDNIIDHDAVIAWLNTLTSDQVNFWIKPLSTQEKMEYNNIPGHDPIIVEKGNSTGKWSGIKENNIVTLGGFNLIIWGCGLTPDYVYPVVDITRPTPNFKTEAVVFCNEVGWKSVKHGYASAPIESFIVARFSKNLTNAEKQRILDDLNKFSDTLCKNHIMNLPEGTKVAFYADDTSNLFNSSAIRVSCIPGLLKVIKLVTLILSLFILLLCTIICFIIIKRFVEANRINIGIMRANGFGKGKIALSLLPFSILPSVVGGVLAYLIGFLLQMPALMLFKDFWTLPTSLVGFSALSFFGCIFVPFILFSVVSLIATMIVLRTKAVELMKAGSEFKANGFSRIAKKPFKKFGIMTRFRVSLAFNSIARLLMLAIVSTLTMSTLVFAMTSYNRLAQSQKINKSQFDYQYSIDLTTPTASGGTYSKINIDDPKGLGQTNVNEYWYNTSWDLNSDDSEGKEWQVKNNYDSHLTRPYAAQFIDQLENGIISLLGDYPYRDIASTTGTLMLPNMADSTGQNWDLMYLQNKFCSRILLDYNIGIGTMSSNPWEIALALMPINSRNLADEGFSKMVQKAGEKVAHATAQFNYHFSTYGDRTRAAAFAGKWFYLSKDETDNSNQFAQFFTRKNDPETGLFVYTLNSDFNNVGYLFMVFKPEYLKLLTTIYSDPEVYNYDYTILYGGVEVKTNKAKPDETYTYVNATISNLSTKPRVPLVQNQEIKIEGITYPSNFINLTDKNGAKLNVLLLQVLENKNIPVVVNAYTAHKYNLRVGSTFDISATNTVDRYDRQMHPEDFVNEKDKFYQQKLEVVGISQGTNGEAFYINQYDANNILGLPDGYSWNKTHKYEMYTEDITKQWDYGSLPEVVDMSFEGNQQTAVKKSTVYTFNGESKEMGTKQIDTINSNIPLGFNGIYTSDKEGKPLTNIISLYSPTGLWPGTAVFSSSGANKFAILLSNGNNLALANKISGLKDKESYEKCKWWLGLTDKEREENQTAYQDWINANFIKKIVEYFGQITLSTSISGAMDVSAADQVYNNLVTTLNMTETSIMAIIIPITVIIVGIISNLIINDSKKMAAMLKALGYSDMKNIMSILALFIPTIVIGLLLAIPLSFGLVTGYQALIFSSANILVDVTQKWWYYAVAVGGIGVVLLATYIVGYRSLKKDRLVDQIK